MKNAVCCIATAVIASIAPAHAAPVTELAGADHHRFAAENHFGSGAMTVAAGITWTSTGSYSVYGYDGGYGFSGNGNWHGVPMTATNDADAVMRFAFATPVAGVAALINYAPGHGTPVIAVHDSFGRLLESTTLDFATDGGDNRGEYHGFLRASADIASFTLAGAYIGVDRIDLLTGPTATVAAVPEPASLALVLAGIAAAAAARRRGA